MTVLESREESCMYLNILTVMGCFKTKLDVCALDNMHFMMYETELLNELHLTTTKCI